MKHILILLSILTSFNTCDSQCVEKGRVIWINPIFITSDQVYPASGFVDLVEAVGVLNQDLIGVNIEFRVRVDSLFMVVDPFSSMSRVFQDSSYRSTLICDNYKEGYLNLFIAERNSPVMVTNKDESNSYVTILGFALPPSFTNSVQTPRSNCIFMWRPALNRRYTLSHEVGHYLDLEHNESYGNIMAGEATEGEGTGLTEHTLTFNLSQRLKMSCTLHSRLRFLRNKQ